MEKTIVKVSPSSLNDLEFCVRLYKFNKLDRLEPLTKEQRIGLWCIVSLHDSSLALWSDKSENIQGPPS